MEFSVWLDLLDLLVTQVLLVVKELTGSLDCLELLDLVDKLVPLVSGVRGENWVSAGSLETQDLLEHWDQQDLEDQLDQSVTPDCKVQ